MTPKGKEKLSVSTKGSLVLFEKLTSCFTKEEMAKFDSLLEKTDEECRQISQSQESHKETQIIPRSGITLNRD